MFTGIVEELGELVARDDLPAAARLTIRGPLVVTDIRPGDSIAVNGVCLTVTGTAGPTFVADVMNETVVRSTLGQLRPGARVNLERAATLATRLGGHLVQGHVDAVGRILAREPAEHWELVRVGLPIDLARYVVEKGSVGVDGVSLTVAALGPEPAFVVSLTPTTLRHTTLGDTQPGAPVNLEVDVLAKHVERLLAFAATPGTS